MNEVMKVTSTSKIHLINEKLKCVIEIQRRKQIG